MEYIHFKTGIPGIIPPDCSELIPPPPEACDEPIVHGPEQTGDGVVTQVTSVEWCRVTKSNSNINNLTAG